MITLVISKNNCGSASPLPTGEYLSLFENKNGQKADADKVCAYLTLKAAYERLLGENMPTIRKNGNGRPEFVTKSECCVDFNLSHTDGLSVVGILSGGGRIGVDAERVREVKNAQKISERYLNKINNSLHNLPFDIEIILAEFDGHNVSFFDTVPTDALKNGEVFISSRGDGIELSDTDDFFSGWTLLEASVKAEGSGFKLACDAPVILEGSKAITLSLKTRGACYKISVCHIED